MNGNLGQIDGSVTNRPRSRAMIWLVGVLLLVFVSVASYQLRRGSPPRLADQEVSEDRPPGRIGARNRAPIHLRSERQGAPPVPAPSEATEAVPANIDVPIPYGRWLLTVVPWSNLAAPPPESETTATKQRIEFVNQYRRYVRDANLTTEQEHKLRMALADLQADAAIANYQTTPETDPSLWRGLNEQNRQKLLGAAASFLSQEQFEMLASPTV